MILVDTSVWIDFFRGHKKYADFVDSLLADNHVAICGPVVTELSRGIRSDKERRRILPLFEGCHLLSDPKDIWVEAGELGYELGRKGVNVKTMDLLIAIYSINHSAPLFTKDRDFETMRKAGIPLVLIKS